MNLLDELKADLAAQRVVAVIGTGVTIESTNKAPTASWLGLLQSGIDHARATNQALSDRWRANVVSDLEYAGEESDLQSLLYAADKITNALGGKTSGEFASWLRRDIGDLPLAKPQLISAISKLSCPIATTNYDHLIERDTNRDYTTWRLPNQVQMAFRGQSPDIVHLHGSWRDPESVIFGALSYGELLGSTSAQALQQSIGAVKSFLFIGCGDGLMDPNFSSLRQWLRTTFPQSQTRHYRLCLEQAVQPELADDRIFDITYGDSHDRLLPFVTDLAQTVPTPQLATESLPAPLPSGNTVDPPDTPQAKAYEALCERVRNEVILADTYGASETFRIDQMLVPPVLLPVTHEQFIAATDVDADARPTRSDPISDLREHKVIIVSAEETAGLTSALEWLITQPSEMNPNAIPIIVNFRDLKQGHRPLHREVQRQMLHSGVISSKRDDLPIYVLAIDDLSPKPEKLFDRVIKDLQDEKCVQVIMGCRQGSESDIAHFLANADIASVTRYIGRFTAKDVLGLAKLASAPRAQELAQVAIQIVGKEHLPRTPYTFSLLLSALLKTESVNAASETALLDAYANLLLGRGDPHQDARFTLDAVDRIAILSTVAEHFVEVDAGSVPAAEVTRVIADYFESLAWSEDPLEVLVSLQDRKLLVSQQGQVRFRHASLLHLFAAKRAARSAEFRVRLFGDMLYYAPMIRHYAALVRDDVDLLLRIEEALAPFASNVRDLSGSRVFAIQEDQEKRSVDDVVGHLDITKALESNSGDHDDSGPTDLDLLDRLGDNDPAPFPVERIDDAAPLRKIMVVLGLASTVVRDSDLVPDASVKERLLKSTLAAYGHLTSELEADDDYLAFIERMISALVSQRSLSEKKAQELADELRDIFSVLFVFAGLETHLASRKLLKTLDKCLGDDEFWSDPRASAMATFLAYVLQEPGWTVFFAKMYRNHGKIRLVHTLVTRIGMLAYYYEEFTRDDELRLKSILIEQYSSEADVSSDAEEKLLRAKIGQELDRQRKLHARSRVPKGLSIFSASPDGGTQAETELAPGDSG